MTSSDSPCGLRLDHQHRWLRAGDHQIELRSRLIGAGRIEQILAIAITHASSADRTVERYAGDQQRRRSTQQRRNIGIDIRIERHHGRDDLHFIEEAVRKQRTDRPIDQARGQRLTLGGSAFALEEAARNASGGIGLLDVVDGQREKITVRLGRSSGRRP